MSSDESTMWLGLGMVALVVGSFVGVVVHRLPQGGDIVFGRSACPACGTILRARDLVPLASWLALGGRCRACRAPIGFFYPGVELLALAVALSAASVSSGWIVWASCGFGWTLLALGLIDLRCFLLPDTLTLPLIPAGLLVAWLSEPEAVVDDALGALGGYAVFVLIAMLYRRWRGREGLGRGDAKLLAGIGAWVGWSGIPGVVWLAAIFALAIAVIRRLRGEKLSATDALPFGPFLAIAGWFIWLHGPLLFG